MPDPSIESLAHYKAYAVDKAFSEETAEIVYNGQLRNKHPMLLHPPRNDLDTLILSEQRNRARDDPPSAKRFRRRNGKLEYSCSTQNHVDTAKYPLVDCSFEDKGKGV